MKKHIILLFIFLATAITACSGKTISQQKSGTWDERKPVSHMTLDYAKEFTVDYYEDDYALITIGSDQKYLVVPNGKTIPEHDNSVVILQKPLNPAYIAASSAMDLIDGIGALDKVSYLSTKQADWQLPHISEAMEKGTLTFAGKYNMPDYEILLSGGCALAVESTMIYHSPDTKEKLETLGIPVLVERSSYESHPLGRMEWIKLYGLLFDREKEADAFFSEKEQLVKDLTADSSGSSKTVAFFYINAGGSAVIHKPGDYIAKMIELAGGTYAFTPEDLSVDASALSTMTIQMESFYSIAKDADVLIYNSSITGDVETIDRLLEKDPIFADFRAVKNGNVWCTEKNMFQQSTGVADMISDLHRIISGTATEETLNFLHPVK